MMFAMHAGGNGRMTEMKATQIQTTLNEIFKAQISYAEGDRNHPFLEEVVSLLCTLFESMGIYRNALYMWHHFLAIQEKMFGEPRKEMVHTYRKLATLYSQTGNPISAQKYLDKTQELMEQQKTSGENVLSKEQKKEMLEEQSELYLQQYLTASQNEDIAKAIEFINKQTACQVELFG